MKCECCDFLYSVWDGNFLCKFFSVYFYVFVFFFCVVQFGKSDLCPLFDGKKTYFVQV